MAESAPEGLQSILQAIDHHNGAAMRELEHGDPEPDTSQLEGTLRLLQERREHAQQSRGHSQGR